MAQTKNSIQFKQQAYYKVWENKPTGILGFYEGQPIVRCSFAPHEDSLKVENSHALKRIDNKTVWSIPIFSLTNNSQDVVFLSNF